MSDGAVVTRNGGRLPNRGVSICRSIGQPKWIRMNVAAWSVIATCRCWPSPSFSRWYSAASIAWASIMPVPVSPTSGPGFIGRPSGSPVIDEPPAKPWATGSKHGKSR